MQHPCFRDREFVRTPEDLFFCVVGDMHPPDRAISYLRYVPSATGKWGQGGKTYRRAMPSYSIPYLMKNIEYLKTEYPDYVFYSDVFEVEMSAVPNTRIAQHYTPQEGMKRLSEMSNADVLQKRAVELAEYLSETVHIPFDAFGVTGSILVDLHNPTFSDIDLTVTGGENGFKLKKTLPALYHARDGLLETVPKPVLQRWFEEKVDAYPLNLEEVKVIQRRQWNYGAFKGTVFSLHPAKTLLEIVERYGDRRFHPQDIVEGKAVISDASESLFNPHIYRVEDFKIQEGVAVEDVREVATYSGFYGGIFEEGETISVYGKLESVNDTRTRETYRRILVGSPEAGGIDYIKPVI